MTTQPTTFPIPPSRRTFVHVPSLGRNVEVEIGCFGKVDGVDCATVRSMDKIQLMPFLRPGTLYHTNLATIPISSIIVTLPEGTGPTIELNPDYAPEEVNAFFDGVAQADKGLKIHEDKELYESARE